MSRRFLLIVGAIVIATASYLLVPQVNTAGQQQGRKIKERVWNNEPIKIVLVKGKGGRKLSIGKEEVSDDDWLRGLSITIKNISKKTILFVELELHFLRPLSSSDETITAFPIIFGTPPKLIGDFSEVLSPNKTWQTSLSNQDYANIGEILARTGYPTSIKEVEIIAREVVFADKTKWSSGDDSLSKPQPQMQFQHSQRKASALFIRPVNFKEILSLSSSTELEAGQCGDASEDSPYQCFPATPEGNSAR